MNASSINFANKNDFQIKPETSQKLSKTGTENSYKNKKKCYWAF